MEFLISEPFYSVLFIGGGMIFLFLEIFIPTGGVLGLLSIASAGFGIFGLFYQGNVAMGFAALWLHEPITIPKLLGAAAVLSGVFLTRLGRKVSAKVIAASMVSA
jgi:membrane-bound ClpP family serine protease